MALIRHINFNNIAFPGVPDISLYFFVAHFLYKLNILSNLTYVIWMLLMAEFIINNQNLTIVYHYTIGAPLPR